MAKQLACHEIAEAWPEMSAEEYNALVKDIKANGLIHPIVLYEGKILDGYHRYHACRDAGIEPRFVDYHGDDPVAHAVSLNSRRRHLTSSQRSLIAAQLANLKPGHAAQNTAEASKPADLPVSQNQAAALMDVGDRTLREAQAVLDSGDEELILAVEEGRTSVSAAAKQARAQKRTGKPAKKTTNKKRRKANDADKPSDRLGRPISSKSIQNAFAQTEAFGEIRLKLESVRQAIQKLGASRAGAYLRMQQIEAEVANVKTALKFAIPYTICPLCKGKGCDQCKNAGWMPRDVYKLVPEEKRWT